MRVTKNDIQKTIRKVRVQLAPHGLTLQYIRGAGWTVVKLRGRRRGADPPKLSRPKTARRPQPPPNVSLDHTWRRPPELVRVEIDLQNGSPAA